MARHQPQANSRQLAFHRAALFALSFSWQPQCGPPVNAILNYAYAALESETRIKAISEGYDPTIGIMHEGSDGSSKFIFDLMEPERPKVDRAVLDFVKGHVFDPADFVIRTDGVCRLNPEMARMVVAKVSA
jgi:CRISPR-associated protein Cas1